MNLRDIRNQIQSLANSKPTNADHLLDIDNLINLAYNHVWHSRPWTWTQRIAYLSVYPDMDYTTEAVSAEVNDFYREVGFTGPIRALTNIWEGHILELNGRNYTILKVLNTSTVQLAEPYRGATDDIETWRFKMRTYALPSDLVSIIALSHRDHPATGTSRKPVPALANTIDEHMALEADRSATYADYYIPMDPIWVPPGEALKAVATEGGTPCTLPASYYYEFAWAFKHGELVGALSDPVVVQVGNIQSVAQAVSVSPYTHDGTLVDSPTFNPDYDKMPNPWEGYRKQLYVNINYNHVTGERLGIPSWTQVNTYDGNISQYDHNPYVIEDDASIWTIRYKEQISPGNPPYTEFDGQYQTLRPFPRINGYDAHYDYGTTSIISGIIYKPDVYWKQLELRYFYKPVPLAKVTDSPAMPYELHQLVVYKALQDYYAKMGNSSVSELWRTNYEKEASRAAIKYVERTASAHVRLPQFGGRLGLFTGQSSVVWKG